jgi:pimeloyl-ACP methyl ester carboxylesterase
MALVLCLVHACRAGVVTLVTHGYLSGADEWVATMGRAARDYPRRAAEYGPVVPIFRLSFDSGGFLRAQQTAGPAVTNNSSGDIVLLLDWNPYSGDLSDVFGLGDAASTRVVGPVVADSLLATNFIPQLGVPLARFPLHLIGHSRGGSLVCEIARRLGERNVVVDHLTLLDPHPVDNDGFSNPIHIDPNDGSAKDGVYENVLFADVDYQTRGNDITVPIGTYVHGAFLRWLDANGIDSDGYDNPHSNVHLWYHGTMAVVFPLTSDGSAEIDAGVRSRWYAPGEDQGAHAGYYYSLRGGGDRREVFQPANAFSGVPPHGLNGLWNESLGIPPVTNRTTVTRTAEERANIVEMNLGGLPVFTNASFAVGAPLLVAATNAGAGGLNARLSYAYNGSQNVSVKVFIDSDESSLNGWNDSVALALPPTGATPRLETLDLKSFAGGLEPGFYRVGVLLSSPLGAREYYAPQRLYIYPNLTLSWVAVTAGDDPGFDFTIRGLAGAAYVLESSDDLAGWRQISTGNLSPPSPPVVVGTDTRTGVSTPGKPAQFFRVRYVQ